MLCYSYRRKAVKDTKSDTPEIQMDLTKFQKCVRLVSTTNEGDIMDERYERLAGLIYLIADGAESFDSDDVRVGNAFMVWSDLEYFKRSVDAAFALARELVDVEKGGF